MNPNRHITLIQLPIQDICLWAKNSATRLLLASSSTACAASGSAFPPLRLQVALRRWPVTRVKSTHTMICTAHGQLDGYQGPGVVRIGALTSCSPSLSMVGSTASEVVLALNYDAQETQSPRMWCGNFGFWSTTLSTGNSLMAYSQPAHLTSWGGWEKREKLSAWLEDDKWQHDALGILAFF
jgi:hypothetical protein